MTTSTIDARVTSPAPEPASPPARTVLRERLSLAALLIGTGGVLYLWNLSINGWANSFYSAAIQAGSESWKAWFFGSSDMANSITVDKPPASLWIPGLSARLFGVNSWSILVPEALMGVASVALLYLITRKYFGHRAGILAGGVLATTPVAALMFRFDNPEALLILLMIAAVWSLMKAVDDGRWRWLILTGVLVGFGFLTKQLQVTLIVPALSVTYLAFGPGGWPPSPGSVVRRPRCDDRQCRLVDSRRRALARVVAAVHRWVTEQLDPRTDTGLQRSRQAQR